MPNDKKERVRKHSGGRRKGATKTRDAILEAAAELFADRGYEGATLRLIGSRAAVDPALISHFFGSKQGLFDEAVLEQGSKALKILGLAMDPDGTSAVALLDAYFSVWEEPKSAQLMKAVIRTSLESETNRGRMQDLLTKGFAEGFAMIARQHGETGELDSTAWQLLASELLGVSISRYILMLKPLADLPRRDVVAQLAPMIEAYMPVMRHTPPETKR